jgi:hypothetical protein
MSVDELSLDHPHGVGVSIVVVDNGQVVIPNVPLLLVGSLVGEVLMVAALALDR